MEYKRLSEISKPMEDIEEEFSNKIGILKNIQLKF